MTRFLLACTACAIFGCVETSFAKSPHAEKGRIALEIDADGFGEFALSDVSPEFGRFTAVGELQIVPTEDFPFELQEEATADTILGLGVVAVEAANGDLLVGLAVFRSDPNVGDRLDFTWQDSVIFSDGTVLSNTGKFLNRRPTGRGLILNSDGTEIETIILRPIIIL